MENTFHLQLTRGALMRGSPAQEGDPEYSTSDVHMGQEGPWPSAVDTPRDTLQSQAFPGSLTFLSYIASRVTPFAPFLLYIPWIMTSLRAGFSPLSTGSSTLETLKKYLFKWKILLFFFKIYLIIWGEQRESENLKHTPHQVWSTTWGSIL